MSYVTKTIPVVSPRGLKRFSHALVCSLRATCSVKLILRLIALLCVVQAHKLGSNPAPHDCGADATRRGTSSYPQESSSGHVMQTVRPKWDTQDVVLFAYSKYMCVLGNHGRGRVPNKVHTRSLYSAVCLRTDTRFIRVGSFIVEAGPFGVSGGGEIVLSRCR